MYRKDEEIGFCLCVGSAEAQSCFECSCSSVPKVIAKNEVETSLYCVPSALSVYFTTSARILQLLVYAAYWESIQLLSVTNKCDNMRYFVGCCQASEQLYHHLCHSFMSRGRRACSPDVPAYVIFSKQHIKWNLLPAALFCLSNWGAIVHKTSNEWMRFISTESGVGTLFLLTQVNPLTCHAAQDFMQQGTYIFLSGSPGAWGLSLKITTRNRNSPLTLVWFGSGSKAMS